MPNKLFHAITFHKLTKNKEEVINPNYPDNQEATIDLNINSDLVDTRGIEDEPINQ